jgi:gliding motility-associated protein GldL
MSTQKKKIGLNTVISWGASVVIIGLMFKILHWQGGEFMIALGLMTESVLFFILGISAMNVVEESADGTDKGGSSLHDLLATSITPKVIEGLSNGFKQFNNTVASVNQVAGSFNTTAALIKELETTTSDVKKFRDNMSTVGTGFDQFSKALTAVSQMSVSSQAMMRDFEGASAGMRSFAKNVTDMNTSFDQFNKTLAAINQMTASSATMMKEFEAATAGMKAYNKNLTDLSKIYQAQLDAFRKN